MTTPATTDDNHWPDDFGDDTWWGGSADVSGVDDGRGHVYSDADPGL